jgi:4-hydroxy-2-oxoheptanedioate aldolase
MDFVNPLRSAWNDGRPVYGLFAGLAGAYSTEVIAAAGPDYVCIDLQHGAGGFDSLAQQIGAVWAGGSAPIVRTPSQEPWQIGKALDLGALGVIVPLVNSALEAAAVVAACRYPPHGERSWGPSRIGRIVGRDVARLAAEALCFVMVETRAALENLDEIAATPGLDGVYVGPSDLALGLGLAPTSRTGGEHAAAFEQILAACDRHGIVPGAHCATGEIARDRAAAGFRLLTVGGDVDLLDRGVRAELRAAGADA